MENGLSDDSDDDLDFEQLQKEPVEEKKHEQT